MVLGDLVLSWFWTLLAPSWVMGQHELSFRVRGNISPSRGLGDITGSWSRE